MRRTKLSRDRGVWNWSALASAVALTATATLGGAALAAEPATTQPTVSDLMQKINDLQGQVQQMKQQQQVQQQANTKLSQQEVDETVARVLQDADKHSKLLDGEGFTAGWDHGRFFLGSSDGNFLLRPTFQLQIRNGTSFRSHQQPGGGDDTQNGFEIRRAKFIFDGNAFTPNLTYLFQWNTQRGNTIANVVNAGTNVGTVSQGNGGEPVLEEAWVKYNFPNTPWYIKGGQFKDPLTHEGLVGSKFRGPEASLSDDIFGNGDSYTQGIDGIYDPKQNWRAEAAFTDGLRSANTNFEDVPNNGTVYDWGAAGRVEYKFFGNWADYNQFTSLNDKNDLLVAGLGIDNSQGGRDDQFVHTVDVEYANTNGLLVYGGYFGRYTNFNKGIPSISATSGSFGTNGTPGDDTYEYSVLGQVNYLFENHIEPYARYEYLHLAGTAAGAHDGINSIVLGANYYLYGHAAKFSAQAEYLPNGIPIADDGADIESSNNHQELVFIAQFQLLL
jgi:TolA-binding protein